MTTWKLFTAGTVALNCLIFTAHSENTILNQLESAAPQRIFSRVLPSSLPSSTEILNLPPITPTATDTSQTDAEQAEYFRETLTRLINAVTAEKSSETDTAQRTDNIDHQMLAMPVDATMVEPPSSEPMISDEMNAMLDDVLADMMRTVVRQAQGLHQPLSTAGRQFSPMSGMNFGDGRYTALDGAVTFEVVGTRQGDEDNNYDDEDDGEFRDFQGGPSGRKSGLKQALDKSLIAEMKEVLAKYLQWKRQIMAGKHAHPPTIDARPAPPITAIPPNNYVMVAPQYYVPTPAGGVAPVPPYLPSPTPYLPPPYYPSPYLPPNTMYTHPQLPAPLPPQVVVPPQPASQPAAAAAAAGVPESRIINGITSLLRSLLVAGPEAKIAILERIFYDIKNLLGRPVPPAAVPPAAISGYGVETDHDDGLHEDITAVFGAHGN